MKKFIKQNRILWLLLMMSIVLILKFSEIPYPFKFLYVLNCFIGKPLVKTWTFEVFRILENLSLAYIASFIFYVITVYYPKNKMEESAFSVMEGSIINLYLYMSDIISFVKYILGIDKLDSEIIIEDLSGLNSYEIKDTIINCKTINIIDGKEQGMIIDCLNPLKNLYKYGNLVKETVDKLTELPCMMYSDFELKKVISSIQSSDFLRELLGIKEDIFIKNNICCKRIGLDSYFLSFIKSHEDLKKFEFKKYDYKRIDIDENEVQKSLKEEVKAIQDNPEILKIIKGLKSQE